MLAFVPGKKISHDMFSMFFYWGILANDVCYLVCFGKWCLLVLAFVFGKKISYDMVSLFFVGVFWQICLLVAAFASGNKVSYEMVSLFFVGVFWQMMFASARICRAIKYHITCFHGSFLACFGFS